MYIFLYLLRKKPNFHFSLCLIKKNWIKNILFINLQFLDNNLYQYNRQKLNIYFNKYMYILLVIF